jgi:type I restriction enzyme M protein
MLKNMKSCCGEEKWMRGIELRIKNEMDNISHRLTQRIKELAQQYETPLPELSAKVDELSAKVDAHLEKMEFSWK